MHREWWTLIFKIERRFFLNWFEEANLYKIKKDLHETSRLSIDQEMQIFKYAKKSGLDQELIDTLKKIDNCLDEKSIFEKPGSHDIFHLTTSHPCIPYAVYIDQKTGKVETLFGHLTTTNNQYEILCAGVEIGKQIPPERIVEYEKITNKKFPLTKKTDKKESEEDLVLNRTAASWMNGKFGDKKLIPLCELDNGKVQYISPTLFKMPLEEEGKYLYLLNNQKIVDNYLINRTLDDLNIPIKEFEFYDVPSNGYENLDENSLEILKRETRHQNFLQSKINFENYLINNNNHIE